MLGSVTFILATLFLSANSLRVYGLPVSDWLYFLSFIFAFFESLIIKVRFFSTWIPRKVFLWNSSLILLGAILSFPNSQDFSVALVEVLQTLYVVTIFVSLTILMVRRGKTEQILTVFIISGVFTSLIAVVDYAFGTNYGQITSNTPNIIYIGRYAGSLGYPNKFGYFLVITSLMTGYKLLKYWKEKQSWPAIIIIIAAILLQIAGVYLSGSIAAYLGLLMGIFCTVYFITPRHFRLATRILFFLMILVMLSIGIIGIHNVFGPQLEISNDSLIGVGINRVINITAGARIDLYIQAWDFIEDNPFAGAGFDQNASSTLQDMEKYFVGSIHNPYIQMWYMGGLFAFLGWLALSIALGVLAIIDLQRQKKNNNILHVLLAATIIAILFMDLSTNAIYQREKWLVVGLFVGHYWGRR